MSNLSKTDLLQRLIDARKLREKLELELASVEKTENDAEMQLIAHLEHIDERGFISESLNVEVEKKESLKIDINAEEKEKAYAFIDEELGRGDAIKIVKQIHWKTLNSLIGDLIKKGQSFPQEAFKSYWKKSIDIKPILKPIKS